MADYVSAIQNGDTLGTPSSVNVIVNGKNETWDIKNDHVELLQSTRIKDINGKEIYEGDIIITHPEYDGEESKRGIVQYESCRAEFSYEVRKGDNRSIWTSNKYRTYEAIGNVHTNPELLEADTND